MLTILLVHPIAIAHLRSRRGLKWAIPAAILTVPSYLCTAYLSTVHVEHGAPRWLLVITLIAFVSACKYAGAGATWSRHLSAASYGGECDKTFVELMAHHLGDGLVGLALRTRIEV